MRQSISLATSAAVFFVNVLPISADDRHQTVFSSSASTPHAHKIAIIGSGPSGSSAAYWLSKAQDQLESLGRGSEGFDIHLYEKEDRIGGRVKVTYPFGDEKRYEAVELGASIFADVNRNMQRAAKVSGLSSSKTIE
jgi:prenylcysteine oxidase / farnesylcysteine lyase